MRDLAFDLIEQLVQLIFFAREFPPEQSLEIV
jgi:hypothetical protein